MCQATTISIVDGIVKVREKLELLAEENDLTLIDLDVSSGLLLNDLCNELQLDEFQKSVALGPILSTQVSMVIE